MFDETDYKSIYSWLFAISVLFTVLVVLWVVFMMMNRLPGNINEQLGSIKQEPFLYKLTFMNASLISITLVPLMIILGLFVRTVSKGLLDLAGIVFLAPYTLLVSIGYSSQYIVLPRILSESGIDGARLWYFGNPSGIPYFLVFLGYTFFALSALTIGWKYIKGKGIGKVIGFLLWLSGITGIMGFVGMTMNNSFLEQSMTISGAFMLPFGIASAVFSRKLQRQSI
ncbi:MAG: hypothetical protein ACM3TR_06860 [Caulobacteraceae bacterium]